MTIGELQELLCNEKYVVGINVTSWYLGREEIDEQIKEAKTNWPEIKFVTFLDCPEISEYFKVSTIPTILYWADGNLKEVQEEIIDKELFFNKLSELVHD